MSKSKPTFESAAEAAVKHFGTHLALAKALGYSDLRNVSAWANGIRKFPPQHCATIEQATSGQVTRQDLRPDDFWKIWPDLAHLAQEAINAQ